jgi:hypothetical protein
MDDKSERATEIGWLEHDEMCEVVDVIAPIPSMEDCCHQRTGIQREAGWMRKASDGEPYEICCPDCEMRLRVLWKRREKCSCGNEIEWDDAFSYKFSELCD